MPFDLLIRGGRLVDGSGAPGRPADVGITGDRIAAVANLSHVADEDVRTVIDATGHVVAPGFVDPHGHSDSSVLVDGALASHLHQGYTTQLSGNCGYTLAPLTAASRSLLDPDMRAHGVDPAWRTFAGYLDAVEAQALGPNVAFLVGHGTIRGAIMGPVHRGPNLVEMTAMAGHAQEAMEAGAFGISTGLIYPPGIHSRPDEIAQLVAVAGRRGGLYATHMRNEAGEVAVAVDEALSTARAAEAYIRRPVRLQVSHLKAAAVSVHGQGPALVAQLERARAEGQDVEADQYPYTAAHTTLATILPPDILALEPDQAVAALRDPVTRRRIRQVQATGLPGWENVAADPGWGGVVIAFSATRPHWNGKSLETIADEEGGDPAELAFDVLADERLAVDVVLHCMDEGDVEAIMAVPWVSVCTDGEARRPGHMVLGRGVPHPRSYGSAPRVLGLYVRERSILALETAVAKMSSVPAARLGLPDRGQLRVGWKADVVIFDPETVAERSTFEDPAQYPIGIRDVIVNGRAAVRDGEETGERPGRLLRRGA
ncbi:MAG: N-acyl-D-amino-acid deacylase family protein [Candidatus Limnocylindrales bacterium]